VSVRAIRVRRDPGLVLLADAIDGRLGDKFGQRKLFLIGMVGFLISANLFGLTWRPIFSSASSSA